VGTLSVTTAACGGRETGAGGDHDAGQADATSIRDAGSQSPDVDVADAPQLEDTSQADDTPVVTTPPYGGISPPEADANLIVPYGLPPFDL
jgi:hypothetical protein